MFVVVICVGLASLCSALPGSAPQREVSEYYYHPGDFILGGLFSFHAGPHTAICSWDLSTELLIWSETMLFAIEQINKRDDILPNVKLGFYIRDDCDNEDIALWSALVIAQGSKAMENCTISNSSTAGQIIGIVGPADSALSLYAAKVGSLHEIPVMAIYATSHELSDRSRFPFFLRAVPPDPYQVEAILDILLEFDWLYSGLVFSADSYGINGGTELTTRAAERGICFAFTSHLPVHPSQFQLKALVRRIEELNELSVIVMFASFDLVLNVLNAIAEAGLEKRLIWIGTDAWPGVSITHDAKIAPFAEGSIVIRLYKATVPQLHDYVLSKDSNQMEVSPWMEEWFESNPSCTSMSSCPIPNEEHDVAIVHTVYTFAYALHAYADTKCNGSSNCKVNGKEFMKFLRNVSFDVGFGRFRFDHGGEPTGRYLIKQIQNHSGHFCHVDIGEWDPEKPENRLALNYSKMKWESGWIRPPISDCTEKCGPGSIPVALTNKCCTGCTPCPPDQIVFNRTECSRCPPNQWPSEDRTVCTDIVPYGICWDDPTVLTSVALAIIGLTLVALTCMGLLRYRDHALIKASSRELSAVDILGLVLTFCTVFPLYATPTTTSCAASEIMIACSLTLLFTASFLKTNRIYRVFRAGKRTAQKPRLISPKDQLALAVALVAIQIVMSIVASVVNPTTPDVTSWPPWELYCPLSYNHLISSVYIFVLIILCCYFAFKARNVPDNFNESKFIAISVYCMVLVCVVAVPVYVTASGTILKVAALSFTLIFNGYLTLFLMYLPKLYRVRFEGSDSPPGQGRGAEHRSQGIGLGEKLFVRSNKISPIT